MRSLAAMACLGLVSCSLTARAAEPAPCQIRVVLFVPSDVTPPTDYQRRVDQMADYAESFFRRELKRWGHDKFVDPFRRSAGHVEVTPIRGKLATAQYKPVPIRVEVMDHLRRQGALQGGRHVWWILVYAGPPPAKFAGYLGGFGPEIGGWAVCNFDVTPGMIDPKTPLGAAFLEKLTLKGMLHELGHGLRLPHIGPLKRDTAGNTPTSTWPTRVFARSPSAGGCAHRGRPSTPWWPTNPKPGRVSTGLKRTSAGLHPTARSQS
jgi:hypothetical protein